MKSNRCVRDDARNNSHSKTRIALDEPRLTMGPKRKFFKSFDSQNSQFDNQSREDSSPIKRAKLVYDFDESTGENYEAAPAAAEIENNDEDSSDSFVSSQHSNDDSGLVDSDNVSIDTFHYILGDEYERPILEPLLLRQRRPSSSSASESPPTRAKPNISTSTPIKVRKQLFLSQEKVDLWEEAMNKNPKLRDWISNFNEELQSIDKCKLDIINISK